MLILQRLAEKVFVVISLLFFSGAISYFLANTNPLYIIIQITFYSLLTVNILLLLARWKKVVQIIFRENLLWLVIGLALFSVLWSELPLPMTLYRHDGLGAGIIAFINVSLFGVYFGTRYSLKEQLRLLAWTFGIAMILSIVVSVGLPRYGVMGNMGTLEDAAHAGAWRGLYAHKNQFGNTMVLSAIVFLLLANSSRRYRWFTWGCFALAVTLILLSTSKTSLVCLLSIIIVLPLYKALWKNKTLALPLLTIFVLMFASLAVWTIDNSIGNVLALLGRDATFTGRTDIWPILIKKVQESPWLGYGYNVFWPSVKNNFLELWGTVARIKPTHAHNGFLDLTLDLGLVGLFIFILTFIKVSWQAVIWARLTKTVEGLWPLMYLTFIVLSNLTEGSLMRESMEWSLYVAVTLSMCNKKENFEVFNESQQRKRDLRMLKTSRL